MATGFSKIMGLAVLFDDRFSTSRCLHFFSEGAFYSQNRSSVPADRE